MSEPSGRAPRSRSRRRLTWGLLVPIVFAAAGVMFAMSFQAAQGRDLRADRDLPQLIMEGDARVADKATALDQLQKEVDALSKTNAPDRRAPREPDPPRRLARRHRRHHQGPRPRHRGHPRRRQRTADSLPDGFTPDDIVVHQQDVQAVVNALWASGAEAMMIQDQRVISTSAVRCVGNTLILQGRVYAPPYRVTAIGDVDRMQRGSTPTPRSPSTSSTSTPSVSATRCTRTARVEFPAYSGSVDFQYASPIR